MAEQPPPLQKAARDRSKRKRADIVQALRSLTNEHKPVNLRAVADAAGVSRKMIYNHPDLLAKIRAQEQRNNHTTDNPAAGEASLIAALRQQMRATQDRDRQRIADLKSQVKELQRTIEVLHGELLRRKDS